MSQSGERILRLGNSMPQWGLQFGLKLFWIYTYMSYALQVGVHLFSIFGTLISFHDQTGIRFKIRQPLPDQIYLSSRDWLPVTYSARIMLERRTDQVQWMSSAGRFGVSISQLKLTGYLPLSYLDLPTPLSPIKSIFNVATTSSSIVWANVSVYRAPAQTRPFRGRDKCIFSFFDVSPQHSDVVTPLLSTCL